MFTCLANTADSDETRGCNHDSKLYFKKGCCRYEATNSKPWMLDTHLQEKPRLVSSIQHPSQSRSQLLSWRWKRFFLDENYDVTVKLTLDLLDIACHLFIIWSYIRQLSQLGILGLQPKKCVLCPSKSNQLICESTWMPNLQKFPADVSLILRSQKWERHMDILKPANWPHL